MRALTLVYTRAPLWRRAAPHLVTFVAGILIGLGLGHL